MTAQRLNAISFCMRSAGIRAALWAPVNKLVPAMHGSRDEAMPSLLALA